MLHTTKISRYVLPLVLTVILSLSARAQGPVYHPGQTIRISVTFAGPDATQINAAGMNLSIPKTIPAQPGFNPQLAWGESKPTGPSTFEVSLKIPDNQASGDYSLTEISATIGQNPSITLNYTLPDFPERKFRIDNPKSITKPTIKDVKELP